MPGTNTQVLHHETGITEELTRDKTGTWNHFLHWQYPASQT
jgi:hypothetical protein